MTLAAPFPWFGGKRRVAHLVWERLGDVECYVEPFFGSGAVLLARPHAPRIETINDADGFVANFWRAVRAAPEEVASWADWPVSEADLHARHYWLVTEGRDRLGPLLGTPEGYDAQVAGWWVWGACCWIGSGWCSGEGPWQWTGDGWDDGDAGQGINRQLPHLGNAGRGINRKLPHLGDAGRGILDWMERLADRLRRVRIAHGDWSRVTGDSVTWRHGLTGVFLDPPYSNEGRATVYSHDDGSVAALAREWAIEAGQRKDMRICLAGYDGEHEMPDGWTCVAWKAPGGFGSQGDGRGRENAARERLWFSPACISIDPAQGSLF